MTAAADDVTADVIVVGAGIAGASAAAELAPGARVLLLEAEDRPGHHTTGRSAALFSKTYGPRVIRALSRASEPFYLSPPPGFAAVPLLTPRGTVLAARADQAGALEALAADLGGAAVAIDGARARELCPILRPEAVAAGALWDDDAQDIDVDALHQGYLRAFRAAGGTLVTRARITALSHDGTDWRAETPAGRFRAPVIVNAAGAWADALGALAGAAPIGLTPKRRTAMIVAAPEGMDPKGWRMAVDVQESWYLKPEAGKLLISPADETPSAPCDAAPEDLDVAICVDRIETACDISIRRIERKWAGLRSFVADKTPVAGWDGARPGFFWLAGQGGYGIQTAPAMGRLAAALALGRPLPAEIADQGVTEAALSPDRLTRSPLT